MPTTRSGNSYSMSNHQIPNNPNPRQPNIQQQITRITTVLEQLTHRLDVSWMSVELEQGVDLPIGRGVAHFKQETNPRQHYMTHP
jgi:hypothetical protein